LGVREALADASAVLTFGDRDLRSELAGRAALHPSIRFADHPAFATTNAIARNLSDRVGTNAG
jgi:hypothetical protein